MWYFHRINHAANWNTTHQEYNSWLLNKKLKSLQPQILKSIKRKVKSLQKALLSVSFQIVKKIAKGISIRDYLNAFLIPKLIPQNASNDLTQTQKVINQTSKAMSKCALKKDMVACFLTTLAQMASTHRIPPFWSACLAWGYTLRSLPMQNNPPYELPSLSKSY